MNDMVYLEDMKLAYENINKDNHEVELKAYAMIALLGVILTIQSTLLYTKTLTLILTILFIASVIFNIISIIFFIKNILIKDYISLPHTEGIIKYYQEDYDEDKYLSTMIGNYKWAIDNNANIMDSKSICSQKGFYSFIISILLLGCFIIGSLII